MPFCVPEHREQCIVVSPVHPADARKNGCHDAAFQLLCMYHVKKTSDQTALSTRRASVLHYVIIRKRMREGLGEFDRLCSYLPKYTSEDDVRYGVADSKHMQWHAEAETT